MTTAHRPTWAPAKASGKGGEGCLCLLHTCSLKFSLLLTTPLLAFELQGHEEQGGMRVYAPSRMQSVKDLPGQTKLKFRCGAELF